MRDARRRASSAVRVASSAPVAVGVGVVVLPVVHVLMRANIISHRGMLGRLPGTDGTIDASPSAVDRAKIVASGVNLGASVWRLRSTSCLARSSLTWWLCRRRGIAADLRFGMNIDGSRTGHAWVEVAGTVVNDASDVRSRFVSFDAADVADDPVDPASSRS